MNLQSTLDNIKVNFMKQVPDDVKVIVGRNQQALYDSGLVETVPGVGASFPVHSLLDSKGQSLEVGKGATVVSFFRGFW